MAHDEDGGPVASLPPPPPRPDPPDRRDRIYEPGPFDVPPVMAPPQRGEPRAQGAENSCTGQALAAAIDLLNARRRAAFALPCGTAEVSACIEKLVPARVSARWLYEAARAHDEFEFEGMGGGSSLRGALKGFYHNGACAEAQAPYVANQGDWALTAEMAKDARRVQLGGYWRLRPELHHYRAALAQVGVVLASVRLHGGWSPERVKANGGKIVWSSGEQPGRSFHAVVLVGYDLEGFFVLNSQGGSWGGYQDEPGLAHWSYDDWRVNVVDAWILQLAALGSGAFNYVAVGQTSLKPRGLQPTTLPRLKLLGHYVNVAAGRFVTAGRYPNKAATARETATFLVGQAAGPNPYPHLLLWLTSGYEAPDDLLPRVARYVTTFKGNGIYPVILTWHRGFVPVARAILESLRPEVEERIGGEADAMSAAIIRLARPLLRPFVDGVLADMAAVRERPGTGDMPRSGDPGEARWALAEIAAAAEKARMRIHVAAVGFGARMAADLIRAARDDDASAKRHGAPRPASLGALARCLDTVHLHVPLLDAPGLRGLPRERTTLYVIADAAEKAVRVGSYRGSVPRLVGEIDRLGSTPYLACREARAAARRLPVICEFPELPTDSAEALNSMIAKILGGENVRLRFATGDLEW